MPRSVLLVWNTASGRRSLIPPTLMPDAEVAVVDRVSLISSRWNLGERLCPELGV
ncbi:MAG TPA: hypothetical protein VE198_18845 [Actinoallomurus sp.]|nr:hypothetical protein [Actinoallomurus sp.]